jgi:hypothetical protein
MKRKLDVTNVFEAAECFVGLLCLAFLVGLVLLLIYALGLLALKLIF